MTRVTPGAPRRRRSAGGRAAAESGALSWEADLPLLSPLMLRQWSAACAVTVLVMVAIVGLAFVAQKEWRALGSLALLAGATGGGLWLLGLVIMAALFRGRYRVRYTLDERGIRCDTVDRVARGANRAAVVVGALARSPQLLGAGLIGRARESEQALWRGAFSARHLTARRLVLLRNRWRTLLMVQCNEDNHAEVAERIASLMQQHGTADRLAAASPLPAYLGRSGLVLLASLPLMTLAGEFGPGLWLPLGTLCFALATVWLVNLFGWVVLAGLVVQAVGVVIDLAGGPASTIAGGRRVAPWALLGPDDTGLLLAAAAGAAALAWLSMRAVRGRWWAALMQGQEDLGA